MRCCPKCGDKFADTDFRTMCGSCLVSLVPCAADDSRDAVLPEGPIAVDIAPVSTMVIAPTITMKIPEILVPEMRMPEVNVPEVRMPDTPQPEMPTEVPQIPPAPATPQPGPLAPPMAPPPDPDYPQPTIVPPTPQPEPDPAPMPQPTPPPTPEPVPAQQRAPQSTPLARTLPQIPVPQVASKGSGQLDRRSLSGDEIGTARASQAGMQVGAVVCGIIALIALFNTHAASFTFFTLLFNGSLIFLTVYLIRQAIYRSAISNVTLTPQPGAKIGAPVRFDVQIGVLRTLTITDAELTIVGEEYAERGSGKSKSVYRHTLFTRKIPITTPGSWPGGSLLTFHPQVTLPADAIPSFEGNAYKVAWKATLWVGIPGWYPDIRLQLPVQIPPVRLVQQTAEIASRQYALAQLGNLNATVSLDAPLGNGGLPVLYAGRKTPFTLKITPNEENRDQKIIVELQYSIGGSVGAEARTVDRVTCFTGGWAAGHSLREDAALTIPLNAPISYNGTHMQTHWSITVRRKTPWRSDAQQVFEVLVVPDEVTA